MAYFDNVMMTKYSDNYNGYAGSAPTTEDEYAALRLDNGLFDAGLVESPQGLFKDDTIAPSWADILPQAATEEVLQNRKNSYPSIGDQLDALFHAGVFPADMAAQIQAVKDANPKPE